MAPYRRAPIRTAAAPRQLPPPRRGFLTLLVPKTTTQSLRHSSCCDVPSIFFVPIPIVPRAQQRCSALFRVVVPIRAEVLEENPELGKEGLRDTIPERESHEIDELHLRPVRHKRVLQARHESGHREAVLLLHLHLVGELLQHPRGPFRR